MTVTVQNPAIEYQTNGIQDTFEFNFRILQQSDLIVEHNDIQQILGIDYTITDLTEAGGKVVFGVPPSINGVLEIYRSTSRDQQVDYEPFTAFPANTHEYGLDKLTLIVQELEIGVTQGPDWNDHITDYANPHQVQWDQILGDASGTHTHPETEISDLDRVRWEGNWTAREYVLNDMVLDDGWLMIANKTTEEKAAPQPIGSPEYLYDGTLTPTNVSAKQVMFGNRYTAGENAYISGYRVETVIGNVYRMFLVNDPTGTPVVTELVAFTGVVDGWQNLAINPDILLAGATVDLVAVVQEPDPTPTTFTGDWDYQTPQNAGAPAAGVITHGNSQPDVINIHKTDDNGGDRSAELLALSVGDKIDVLNVSWAIQNLTDAGAYVSFGISPAIQATPDGIHTFTFETVTATPISYGFDTDYWLSSSVNAQGLFGADTAYGDIVPNDTAYGTDLQVQSIYLSPDWDVASAASVGSGGGAGGGGGGGFGALDADEFATIENGFVNRADSAMTFTDGTRTFEISPTGAAYSIVDSAKTHIIFTAKSIQIPDAEGLHYIYFDGTDLVSTQTFSLDIISEYAFCALVYWDATNSESILFGDERHGNTMDSQTHIYNHETFGARYGGGLSLGNMDVDGSGNDATAAQLSVADGVIWDEDIKHTITDDAPQNLQPIAQIPMFYRTGAAGAWRRVTATDYIIATTGSGRAAWNELTGGSWQLTEAGNNNFVLVHLIATNDIAAPVIGLVGQSDYGTVLDARMGAEVELNNLMLGAVSDIYLEYVPIGSVILQTANSYSNAVKSRVRSTDLGDDYIDWRTQRFGAGGSSAELPSQLGSKIVPSASADPGAEGEVAFDGSYFYIYSGGQWVRTALATF